MNDLTPFDSWRRELDNMFGALHDEMFNVFGRKDSFIDFATKSAFPKVNILQKEEDLVVEVAIPHYHPENIEVSIQDGILTVKGAAVADSAQDGQYLVREVAKRAFSRSWQLPKETTEEQVSAKYDHGVLYLTIKGIAKKVAPKKVVKKIEISK